MNEEQIMYANLDALLAQQTQLIATKTLLLSQINGLLEDTGEQDVVSKSKSGEAGSTSFTYVSLNEKLNTLMAAERTVIEAITVQKELIAASYPYWIMRGFC